MAAAADQYFEGPHCPEGHQCEETLILANYSGLLAVFKMDVITKQTGLVSFKMGLLAGQFFRGDIRNRIS